MTTELIDASPYRGWDSFIPYVNPYCMGVPAEIIGLNCREAAIEFTERSGILTQSFNVNLQANVNQYPIELDKCYRFIALKSVCSASGIRYAPNYPPHCCSLNGFTFFWDNDAIVISPTPFEDEEDALTVSIVVSINRDALYCPEELYQDYLDAIKYGALTRILEMNNQVWHDQGGAIQYKAAFQREVNRARIRVEKSKIRGPLKMRARRFV